MRNPIGHVALKEAVEILSRGLEEGADVPRVLAEAFESGAVVAAYRESRGIRPLDPETWHSPAWRAYFEAGTVELALPLLDDNARPHPQGFTTRCICAIFVRHDTLTRFMQDMETSAVPKADAQLRPASERDIRAQILDAYRDDQQPNILELPKIVRPALNARGLDASDRNIMKIGKDPQYAALRRPVGKTKGARQI